MMRQAKEAIELLMSCAIKDRSQWVVSPKDAERLSQAALHIAQAAQIMDEIDDTKKGR